MGASHFQMELANLAKCLLLSFMILWIQIHRSKGCFEAERLALLNFKKFVVSDGADADHLLSSWVDDSMSDCCKWERVTCNSTTSHVIELFLNNTRQHDKNSESFYNDENIWFIKLSMFQQLKELRNLNLSYNEIGGFIDYDEGFERLSELKKLQTLDLTYNCFNNSVLLSLGALTSLKSLTLSWNKMRGSFPSKELNNLKNLEILDISGNGFIGSLSLEGFEKLEELDINYNRFNNSVLSSLGALTSLKSLFLSWNNMRGSFPSKELNSLKNLKILDISVNEFNGSLSLEGFERLEDLDISYNRFNNSILSSLGTLTSLRTLKIGGNSMEGSLPIQELNNLKNLEILDISGNWFNGFLSLEELNNLTNLEVLDLRYNQFNGSLLSLSKGTGDQPQQQQ